MGCASSTPIATSTQQPVATSAAVSHVPPAVKAGFALPHSTRPQPAVSFSRNLARFLMKLFLKHLRLHI